VTARAATPRSISMAVLVAIACCHDDVFTPHFVLTGLMRSGFRTTMLQTLCEERWEVFQHSHHPGGIRSKRKHGHKRHSQDDDTCILACYAANTVATTNLCDCLKHWLECYGMHNRIVTVARRLLVIFIWWLRLHREKLPYGCSSCLTLAAHRSLHPLCFSLVYF
jgi:hypothetical protein